VGTISSERLGKTWTSLTALQSVRRIENNRLSRGSLTLVSTIGLRPVEQNANFPEWLVHIQVSRHVLLEPNVFIVPLRYNMYDLNLLT